MEAKTTTERVETNYRAMKKDVVRHETLCFELAKKYEE
jgi:hypothetical protein